MKRGQESTGGQTERRTNGQTDGRSLFLYPPLFPRISWKKGLSIYQIYLDILCIIVTIRHFKKGEGQSSNMIIYSNIRVTWLDLIEIISRRPNHIPWVTFRTIKRNEKFLLKRERHFLLR